MNIPTISIVIPTLNEEKLLPLLLEDLAQQTYTHIEVIVADGGSKDKTQAIVKDMSKTHPWLRLVVCPTRGVGAQRNYGASQASAPTLIFFDADNRIPVYFLEGVHYHLQQTPCDGFTNWCKPDTNTRQDILFINTLNTLLETMQKIGSPYALGACIGCSKTVFEKIGGFDESITYMEDVEIVRRLVQKGYYFHVFRDPLYTYSLRRMRKEGTLRLYRKLLPYLIRQTLNQKITEPLAAYPMLGGTYFDTQRVPKKKKKQSFERLMEFDRMFRSMNKRGKKLLNAFTSTFE